MIKYFSPTSFKLASTDLEAFFKKYLSGLPRIDNFNQTKEMALGSAFDSRVKAHLYKELIGSGPTFDDLLKCDAGLRDLAVKDSQYLFDLYIRSGTLADLVYELNQGLKGSLTFEFKMTAEIPKMELGFSGPPLQISGKPDLHFVVTILEPRNEIEEQLTLKHFFGAIPIIHDWKVNGFYSEYPTSPIKNFYKVRENKGLNRDDPSTWGSWTSKAHKEFTPVKFFTERANLVAHCQPLHDEEWLIQLTMYAWMCGVSIGGKCLHGIEQVLGNPNKVRFASARFLGPSADYQQELIAKLYKYWEIIHSDHIFRDLSYEDSKRRCEMLTLTAQREMQGLTNTDVTKV